MKADRDLIEELKAQKENRHKVLLLKLFSF